MNPILVRNVFCSFPCKFSQQLWSHGFAMIWSVFILIIMMNHLRGHLGYLCRQTAPWWRVSINRNQFSFTSWNDSFLEQRITCRIAGRAPTRFLVAIESTSFLAASGSSFSCEQFVTGPELFFGYHNVRCVRKFNKWRNRNFYPSSIKNFHNLKFQNWSNDCAFGNSCHQKRSRKCVFPS